jgi:very-short-patch-repair endonuclease
MSARKQEANTIALARRLRRSMTNAEIILWSRLRHGQMHGLRFRRQHSIGPYVADFACAAAMLVIEVDGETHHTPEQVSHDARRRRYLASRGWKELRVSNRDVYENLIEVLDGIWREASRGLRHCRSSIQRHPLRLATNASHSRRLCASSAPPPHALPRAGEERSVPASS